MSTFLLFPTNRKIIDTYEDSAYLSNKDPNYYIYGRNAGLVVRGRSLLSAQGKKLIILGASSSVEGFRPKIMQKHLGNTTVHNMSIGASNLTQLKQIIELVYEVTPPRERSDIHFVLGLFYVLLRPDGNIWKGGSTNIQKEMLRFGLYHQKKSKFIQTFNSHYMPYAISLMRPVLAVDALINRLVNDPIFKMTLYFNNKWIRPMSFLITDDLDQVVVNDAYKEYINKIMLRRMGTKDGTINDEQFQRLLELSTLVSNNGGKLTIIDLPIPKWHASNSAHYQNYQLKKMAYLDQILALKGINLIDMQLLNDDYDFYDFAHPKPKTSHKWSTLSAQQLAAAMDKKRSVITVPPKSEKW